MQIRRCQQTVHNYCGDIYIVYICVITGGDEEQHRDGDNGEDDGDGVAGGGGGTELGRHGRFVFQ